MRRKQKDKEDIEKPPIGIEKPSVVILGAGSNKSDQEGNTNTMIIRSEDVRFDESDKNLFQVDDPRLRADAIKHSILPRLHFALKECISLIERIYGIEVFDDSIISFYPQFRPKRENNLKHLYDAAYTGLAGKRVKNKWHGVERKDGKPVHILPYRYGLQLSEEGLCLILTNTMLSGLTNESQKKLFDFHIEYESLIYILCSISGMRQVFFWQSLALDPRISNLKQYLEYKSEIGSFDNDYVSEFLNYPISSEELFGTTYALSTLISVVTMRFACFYPIYDSYLQIAKGEKVRFVALIEKLKQELTRIVDEAPDYPENSEEAKPKSAEYDELKTKEAAEQRIKVMPAIRWRVFQRDGWKCISCGRGSQDDAILHIDHIVPRSKGGKDSIENYQTLCHLCNIGKSNRDNTDLRKSR